MKALSYFNCRTKTENKTENNINKQYNQKEVLTRASTKKDSKAPFKPLALAIALVFSSTVPNMTQAATFTVSNTLDTGAGSLRRAVFDANSNAGNDIIVMSIPSGSTIDVVTEILITDSVQILGPATDDPTGVTLNGMNNSRHFNTSISGSGNFLSLYDMTLTNGYTSGSSENGGSTFVYNASLTLDHCIISGNSTVGEFAKGGGFFMFGGNVTLTQSTISNNSTIGLYGQGGGFDTYFGGQATLTQSTISGNSTAGSSADGGGFSVRHGGDVTLINSTVSGNSTTGVNASGGGFKVYNGISSGDVTLAQSTVSGNSTAGLNADGGGFEVFDLIGTANVTLTQSTISNNSSVFSAGGLSVPRASIKNSIISGNTGPLGNINNSGNITNLSVESSLFGDPLSEIGGNSTGAYYDPLNDPKLGPLQGNGGPTLTHNPLPIASSQIIDTGNNAFAAAFLTDQRGNGFARINNTTVDMGAVEWQPTSGLTEILVRRDMARNIITAIEGPAYTPPIAQNPIYDDVMAGDVNADWIAELKSRGFTEGCAVNRFCPNMIVTKEQIAKVHLKAKMLDPPMPSNDVFLDVQGPHNDFLGNPVAGAFAWDYITKMRDQGYSTGCENSIAFINGMITSGQNYCPDNPVTRDWFDSLLNTLP